MLDITKIPLDDPAVWDLICDGHVKGVFQIESRLGKAWCRRMKPRNIEELSDLTSAIRPGTLQSKEDGKSMTQHYSDRKSGVDEVKSLHPSIDDIVKSTQGIILFQEQSIQIAVKMAGFTEEEGEALRKAIGKKQAELMASIKVDFINGCIKNGHSKEDAERIFGIIEKSSRYSFNKSVGLSTTVETEDGVSVSIKDVKVNTKIKTPDGYSTVIDKLDHGTQDVFRVELDNGRIIECTILHKFLCTNGEILPLWQIMSSEKEIVSE